MVESTPFKVNAILMALATLVGCTREAPPQEPAPRPVEYVQVLAAAADDLQTYSGVTKAEVDAQMSFKVAGTVVDRPVSVGDTVAAGDLLARLDQRDYRVALQQAQAGLATAIAQLRNASAEYDRTTELYENSNAAKADLDRAQAAFESAEAMVAAAREQVHGAELQVSYTTLRAPQACTVAKTFVKENENVAPGQPVLQLNCGRCAQIEAYLPETHIGWVEASMPVEVTVEAIPEQRLDAVVTEIGVASGAAGATYPVTAQLTGACPELRSGMVADVHMAFRLPEREGRIALPTVAVGEDRDGNFVYTLEQGGDAWTARRRAVVVGEITDRGELVIADGLAEGEYVATAGVRRIQDGLTVRLLENNAVGL